MENDRNNWSSADMTTTEDRYMYANHSWNVVNITKKGWSYIRKSMKLYKIGWSYIRKRRGKRERKIIMRKKRGTSKNDEMRKKEKI